MYVLRRPARELGAFIEHYWFVLDRPGESSDLRVEVFVDARADLIFTFGAPYRREVINGSALQVAYANVDAQRLVPIRIVQRGSVRVAGVRFTLGGLGPFTDAHLADWSGATPPPERILGAGAVRLEKELRDTPDPDDAAVALDGFFLEQLGRHGPHPGFWRAPGLLQDGGGRVAVGELAGAADVSLRHLERLFARELGFSPRTVARVLRFQHVLRGLMNDEQAALGELALAAGYFDQAQCIRDFRRSVAAYRTAIAATTRLPVRPTSHRTWSFPCKTRRWAAIQTEATADAGRRTTMTEHGSGLGSAENPWRLRTPPLSSAYTMHLDEQAEPTLLVCQVVTTRLTYLARAIDDLHAELLSHGDWIPLGAADEQKSAAPGTVEAWGRSPENPVGGWYGQRKGLRGRFAMYLPPLLETLGLVELEHNARNNRVRALPRAS